MPLHVSPAVVSRPTVRSGESVEVTVNCHVDKDRARGGARYSLPPDRPVFFELPQGRFKRVFVPMFELTRDPAPVTAKLPIVATESLVSVPIDVEVADLDETPPDTRLKAVVIDVRI